MTTSIRRLIENLDYLMEGRPEWSSDRHWTPAREFAHHGKPPEGHKVTVHDNHKSHHLRTKVVYHDGDKEHVFHIRTLKGDARNGFTTISKNKKVIHTDNHMDDLDDRHTISPNYTGRRIGPTPSHGYHHQVVADFVHGLSGDTNISRTVSTLGMRDKSKAMAAGEHQHDRINKKK